jgi:hypothetical protein
MYVCVCACVGVLFNDASSSYTILEVLVPPTQRRVKLIKLHIFNSFKWPNPSSRTMPLGSTRPLTEMSTKNFPGGKGLQMRKADNLTAICEPIV